MTHARETPQGRAMGKSAARLAKLGQIRLVAEGLTNLQHPRLRDEMCKTCACQPGSVPNGCPQTQMDFLKSVIEGRAFLCHSPKDGRMCAGWIRARAEHAANPMPQEVQELIGKWEYSPPD
jgi:predicted carbohydrate-binding protein with CBM5 and CBM33 domain